MKLIKKIAAIMFAFMMVVSMSCNVKADDTTIATTGTITINNAVNGQTYTIYKILDLESYSSKVVDGKETGNFAYKPSLEWESFIKGKNVKDKYFTFEGEYVSWKENADPAEFAKLALEYAKNNTNTIHKSGEDKAVNGKVQFTNLSLGYYLVDSSVGALCSLDTTKPGATIKEKNGVPSVDKKVSNSKTGPFDTSSIASIGDKVYFKTTITAQPGAQNYVLHDKMTEGLTFNQNSVNVSLHKNATNNDKNLTNEDYSVVTTGLESTDPKCTFHINFTKKLCDGLEADDTITVTYSATLNKNAVIAGEGNKNETKLKYGDSQETQPSVTNTKTFKMYVFKYTENRTDKTKKDGLADAVFILKKDGETNTINFEKEKTDEINGDVYHVANTGDANITTNKSGKFTIKGLGAGTYYLTETKQPAGYNKLSGPVKVEIGTNGNVTVGGTAADPVEVENKTGTVLPSTGGAGTTMIYLIGGALVLGSGVVLVTKRRVKGK